MKSMKQALIICAASSALMLASSVSTMAQNTGFKILHQFSGNDGARPIGGLAFGPAGSLYGTTYAGGNNDRGTLFRLQGRRLVTFGVGGQPEGTPVVDSDGNATLALQTGGINGKGSVVSWDPRHGLKTIYSFTGGVDGELPLDIVRAGDGTIWGTASLGGNLTGDCAPAGCGTIYKITPGNQFQLLHEFNGADGYSPFSRLVRAQGRLYGTTIYNAHSVPGSDAGSAFWIDEWGHNFTTISMQNAGSISYNFEGGLVKDSAGNLWGTAIENSKGYGSIYKISADGVFSVAYIFSGSSDGAFPFSNLEIDSNDVLYGTTHGNDTYEEGSGVGGWGTVFSFNTRTSEFTTLHTFAKTDGANPRSGVLVDPAGNLYGATEYGGKNDLGVIFEISR